MTIKPQPHSWTLILEGGPELPNGRNKRAGFPGPVHTYRMTVAGVVHKWRQKEVREVARECVMEYVE